MMLWSIAGIVLMGILTITVAVNMKRRQAMTVFFKKAVGEQAFVKVGMYGVTGSGKTFTGLLGAEGLAKHSGGRVAYVDTERGTDFYCQTVKAREIHPEAFDFDALYTRSIAECIEAVKHLDPKVYSVVVIDSISHIWDAAQNAYRGKRTSLGGIPMPAWPKIKKPYKELMTLLLGLPMHVIICGRQGDDWSTNENGEMERVGVKMRAEKETAYEPHILIRMEAIKNSKHKHKQALIQAFVEKDRTGILAGKIVENPTYATLFEPFTLVLSTDNKQAKVDTEDVAANKDADAFEEEEKLRIVKSRKILETFSAQLTLCKDKKTFDELGKEIKKAKKELTNEDVAALRELFLDKAEDFKTGKGK